MPIIFDRIVCGRQRDNGEILGRANDTSFLTPPDKSNNGFVIFDAVNTGVDGKSVPEASGNFVTLCDVDILLGFSEASKDILIFDCLLSLTGAGNVNFVNLPGRRGSVNGNCDRVTVIRFGGVASVTIL